MAATVRGLSGRNLRDSTLTWRELAKIDWAITAPLSGGDLTGPPTDLTGSFDVDGTTYVANMTITRDADDIPTQAQIVIPGFSGESDYTITWTPVRDSNGELIGETQSVV